MTFLELICEQTGARTLQQAAERLSSDFRPYIARTLTMRDLAAAARANGVTIRTVKNADFEGRYSAEAGIEEIVLREGTHEKRLLFTLAHELGHMLIARLLRQTNTVRFRSSPQFSVREEEQLADAIAAELLMPANQFRTCIARHGLCFRSIEQAKREFGTSRAAILRRVTDLCRRNTAILNLVPTRIFDVSSKCMVDEATFMVPGEVPQSFREEVFIVAPPKFSEVQRLSRISLTIQAPLGRMQAHFETRAWAKPCPNIDLLSIA